MEVGAIQVPINPKSSVAEIAGFVQQVDPALVVTDADLAPAVEQAVRETGARTPTADIAALYEAEPDGRGPGQPRRARRRRDDPDVGHDRPLEAGDADPPRLRDGGGGLPVLDAAHERRPAADLAAAVPHQRARVLDARVDRGACEPRAARPASRRARSSTTRAGSARPSSTASARCSRSSCASRRAPTTPTTRSASATRARRPTASTSSRSRRGSASRSCAATRCRRSPYALDLAPRRAPVRDARLRAPASGARSRQRRARHRRRSRRGRRRGGRARAAQPRDHARLLRDARGDGGGDRRRLAAHRRPRARQRRRDVHVSRPQEGSDPPARREPLAGGGGGDARTASRRGRGRGDRRAVGPLGGGREGVRGRGRRSRRPTWPRCTRSRGSTSRPTRCRATSRWSPSCRTPRPTGSPSTSSPATARRPKWTSRSGAGSLDPDDRRRRTATGRARGSAARRATRSTWRAATSRARSWAGCTLTELTYLLVTRREPTPQQTRVLDAVLVSLADHGLTPSALAARLTYTGAPEAIQGAVAAGLLGAGSVFLGPAGDTAQFLFDALRGADAPADADDATLRRIAEAAVDARRAAGERVPGLGHPVHKDVDPRTPRLYAIAAEQGLLGPHLRLLEQVADGERGAQRQAPARQRRRRGRRRARGPRTAAVERARCRADRAHGRARRAPRGGGGAAGRACRCGSRSSAAPAKPDRYEPGSS